MKRNFVYVVCVVVAILIMVIGVTQISYRQVAAKNNVKWEYMSIGGQLSYDSSKLISDFNKLGREGWELVIVQSESPTVDNGSTTSSSHYFVFKRAKE